MASRTKSDADTVAEHRDNVKRAARVFKAALQNDRGAVGPTLKAGIARGMWEFSTTRRSIQEELRSMADLFRGKNRLPDDFVDRIGRLSISMYLLEKMEAMHKASMERKAPNVSALFETARQSVARILDDSYFSKTLEQIVEDYLDGEMSIEAAAASCGVKLVSLGDASELFKKQISEAVQAILAEA